MPQDDRTRLLLAVVISILILLVWQVFFVIPGEQERLQNSTSETAEEILPPQVQRSDLNLDEASIPSDSKVIPVGEDRESLTQGDSQGDSFQDIRVSIDTTSLLGSINLRGAKIDDLILRNYNVDVGNDSEKISLLVPSGRGEKGAYFMQLGWVGRYLDGSALALPDHQTIWQVQGGADTLSENSPLTIFWINEDNIRFEIEYQLDKDYLFRYQQRVRNNSGKDVYVRPYGLLSRAGTPVLENFYILHEGFIGYFSDSHQEIDYTDISDSPEKHQRFEGEKGGWLGITDKYWLTALVPPQDSVDVSYALQAAPYLSDFRYQADMLFEGSNLVSGSTHQQDGMFFAGAKRVNILDRYEADYQIPSFDRAVDFGWLYFLTKPTFYLLDWIFEQTRNFGLAILALTVLIKLLFFPLAQRSYRSISKMKLLQPKMETLRERYKDDRQALSKAMMELYRVEKVNPLAGCLPILLQIPVFFALYKVLFVTIEMRHAPFYGWIDDLSVPDPLGLLTLFGLVSWNVPAFLEIINIGIWPILMGFTMWLQQKIQPAPPDPIQARIFAMLPIVFTFVLATFPAGLVIYWTWNNLLSIGQQSFIMRSLRKQSSS